MLSPSWGSQDPKRNRSPRTLYLGRVRVDSDLELSEYFLGALCFCGVSTESFSLCLYRPSPRHFTHSAKAMGVLLPANLLDHIYKPQRIVNTAQIGDPVICYLRPHREFGTSVFPRGSYLVGRFADYQDPGHFVGKGWMRLEFDRLILSPTTEVPIATRVVAVRRYRMDPEGKIIERGAAEMMICGGTEAAITPMGIGGFSSMKALSTRNDDPRHASWPFDAQRDGFVVGEGAGILILELLEHAQKRNAPIFAEIVGYGMSGDACHITRPAENGDGAYRVMKAALNDAKLAPEDIGYVNAHGTSTPIGDVIETRALKRLFGERMKQVPVSSTKSMTGHLLGGAGGLEAGISVLALRDQILPPTINQEAPDPECDLDYVPNAARKASVDYALSNSFGFGGTNAALIFSWWTGK